MAKIHRSDAPLPQAPSVQVKASYTVTDLPKVSPQEPAAFYDQDNDEDYRRRETAKCKKKRGNLLYTLAMIVFAAIFLISGGLLVKRFLDDRKTESEFADLQSMIDTAATPAPAGENVNPNGARFAALRDKNSDFVGWISIDGTNLDFPVMYAPDNKDFYLRHDFNKAYSVYGVPGRANDARGQRRERQPDHLRPQYENRHDLRLPDRVPQGRLLSGAPLH